MGWFTKDPPTSNYAQSTNSGQMYSGPSYMLDQAGKTKVHSSELVSEIADPQEMRSAPHRSGNTRRDMFQPALTLGANLLASTQHITAGQAAAMEIGYDTLAKS
jgi:hypothetical protein